MKRSGAFVRVLRAINNYLVFFLVVAFAVTCCTLLFVTVMSEAGNIPLTDDNIRLAAKLTMLNVALLTLILTVCDAIRRRLTVDRPVGIIIEALERMTRGDLTVRVPKIRGISSEDKFGVIAEYFNKMAEELSHSETLKLDFVANVSHELKTPLAIIKNYATLLSAPDLDEEDRREYRRGISEAADRLATLVSNILKLNKLENQKIKPALAPYDLSEQVCECLIRFEDVWEKKGINIETDIEDGVTAFSDREMLDIVWHNLFSNALKFTEGGGKVSVSVKRLENVARVEISDTGCGISPEAGRHIFDKFYQVQTAHSTEGNGLGLALVKRIADLVGCDISVESELGRGTSFAIEVRCNEGA